MQVSFNPLDPQEADAVRCFLNTRAGVPLLAVPDSPPAARAITLPSVPDGSQSAPVALLTTRDGVSLAAAPGIALASEAASLPVPPAVTPPKSHKKKAAPPSPTPAGADATAGTPTAAAGNGTPSIGDLLANSTPPAAVSTVAENVPTPHVPATPAPLTGPTAAAQAAAGAKPLNVEDVRAAYRDLFAVIGDEKGKEELRKELAKVGSATVSDLKPGHFAAVVRSLNAATILAKAKVAPAAAAAPAKDPLL